MTGVMLFVTQEAGRLVVLIPPVCEPDWMVNEQVILEIRTVPSAPACFQEVYAGLVGGRVGVRLSC